MLRPGETNDTYYEIEEIDANIINDKTKKEDLVSETQISEVQPNSNNNDDVTSMLLIIGGSSLCTLFILSIVCIYYRILRAEKIEEKLKAEKLEFGRTLDPEHQGNLSIQNQTTTMMDPETPGTSKTLLHLDTTSSGLINGHRSDIKMLKL